MDQTQPAVAKYEAPKPVRIRVTPRMEVPWKSSYTIPKQHHFYEDPAHEPRPGEPRRLLSRGTVETMEFPINVPTIVEVEPRLLADLQVDKFLEVKVLGPDDEDEDEHTGRQGDLLLTDEERASILASRDLLARRAEHELAAAQKPKAKPKFPPKRKAPSNHEA